MKAVFGKRCFLLSRFSIFMSFLVQKMFIYRSGQGCVMAVGNVLCLLIVVISMSATCDACGRGSSSTPTPRPSKPSAMPSRNPSFKSLAPNTAASTIIPTAGQHEYCFSTTSENLTNETIKRKLDEISHSGKLDGLFTDSKEASVVLQRFKEGVTGCANVTSFLINITRDNDTKDEKTSPSYKYNITLLNQTLAMKYCQLLSNCQLLPFSGAPITLSILPPPTTASSKIVEEISTKETNTAERKRTPAASSGDDGVSLTIIVIPVVVALLLVVLLVIVVLWFKRRSTRKLKTEDKTPNSSAEHFAGPINGDVYTIVNPNAEKKKKNEKSDDDLVYTELSDMKPEKPENDKAKQNEKAEYADITHILTAGDTTYENVAPQTEQEYANAVELNSENL